VARYGIPKDAGRFRIEKAMAGNWMVLNDKTGGGKIAIACRDLEQAEWLCDKLNRKDHDGEIWM
jgi:hypothetical protein